MRHQTVAIGVVLTAVEDDVQSSVESYIHMMSD